VINRDDYESFVVVPVDVAVGDDDEEVGGSNNQSQDHNFRTIRSSTLPPCVEV
jgi:hypothetical protein